VNNTVYLRWLESVRIAYGSMIEPAETGDGKKDRAICAIACNYRRQLEISRHGSYRRPDHPCRTQQPDDGVSHCQRAAPRRVAAEAIHPRHVRLRSPEINCTASGRPHADRGQIEGRAFTAPGV